jgi:uncharacterized membrane protein YphA (DoxX/SURF4 family)
MGKTRGPGSKGHGLRALSVALRFPVLHEDQEAGLVEDPGPLVETLRKWQDGGPLASRWYIEKLALPGAPLFARVVPLAELSAGVALVCGFQMRLAAGLALGMILNFHFAADVIFHYKYLTNGYGLPVLAPLALALGGTRLWSALAPEAAHRGRLLVT